MIARVIANTTALEKQIDEMVRASTHTLLPQGLTCLREWDTHRQTPEVIALVEGKR